MNLIEAIQSIPQWETKTAQQIFDELTELRTEPDPTPYNFLRMGQELARRGIPASIASLVNYTMFRVIQGELALPQGYETAKGDINSAYLVMSLKDDGLSLHLPERQALVGLLSEVGQWDPGVAQAVLSLGVRQYTLASEAGLSIVLGDVEAALGQIQLEALKQPKRIAAATRYNAYVDALDAWDGVGAEPVL